MKKILLGATATMLIMANSANAFYATTDVTEPFYVLPNETAFLVPDGGRNQDTQGMFPSAEYYSKNAVASKMVIIPHAKMSGSGGTSWTSGFDYYVPTARMFVVVRNPFFQDWTKPGHGTDAQRDEEFYFESKDSVDIDTGITIGAHIKPEDAATYLFNFGIYVPANENLQDPKIQYQSVFYAMPLDAVMDGIVHAEVQASLSREFGSRSFADGYASKLDIIKTVQKDITEKFAKRGITIDFLGFSGSLNFDAKIQDSIDRKVIATNDIMTANTYACLSG